MNTDGEYLRNSTAYVVQSWDNDAELLALHEGFFLQTAAINDYEDLHFRLPVYSGSAPILASPRPMVMLRNSSYEGDIMQVKPDEDADKHLTYTLGRDGVKWLLRDVPQLYMLSDKLDSRISLAGAAPVETDLQLGVSIPEPKYTDDADFSALNAQQFTFSLPEKEAYSDYEYVWLIDRSRNNIVNLMQGDYTTTINSGEDNSRFQLRFG